METVTPEISIRHYGGILNTPGLPLAIAGWDELLKAGWCDTGGSAVGWDHKAIVAFSRETAIGVLTWTDQEHARQIWINLAYVAPTWRRMGIHNDYLWPAIIGKARELKRPFIASGANVNNVPSRQMQRLQGRIETFVQTRFEVPILPDPFARP